MNWYHIILSQYKTKPQEFEDIFGFSRYDLPKVIKKDPPEFKEIEITLYRGFDVDLNKLKREGNLYILSPEKSEQGVLWFTHSLMTSPNPIEYVKGRGKYILTYPLKVQKHFQKIYLDNGDISERVPEEILDKSEPTENSSFWGGIELPPGFYFSYKTQKFIICDHPIAINPKMIVEDNS